MVMEVGESTAVLQWDPPEDDGGCEISSYIIEYNRVYYKSLLAFYLYVFCHRLYSHINFASLPMFNKFLQTFFQYSWDGTCG